MVENKDLKKNKSSSLKLRTITGIIMAAVVIGVLFIPVPVGIYIFQAGIIFFALIGALEMIKMFETESKFSIAAKACILVITALIILNIDVYSEGAYEILSQTTHGFQAIMGIVEFLPLLILGTIVILGLTVFDKNFDGKNAGKALLVIFYVGLGMSSIFILRLWGIKFLVYAILISSSTDVFAYLIGSAIGKHKMAPTISPKKSWEGAIAGTIIATAVASCFALFYGDFFPDGSWIGEIFNSSGQQTMLDSFDIIKNNFSVAEQAFIVVPITLVASVVGQIGDLIASRFKRTYEIKDFGNIFPGHGGVMDRLDSIIFLSMFLVSIFLLISGFEV